MARVGGVLGGLVSAGGAIVSSLCCVLPLAIVLLGLGSGAFMATTMKYGRLFVPVGVLSVITGFYLHFRERRRCAQGRCPMVGRTWGLALLSLSAAVVALALLLTVFPNLSADFLLWATARQGPAGQATPGMPMGSMR